MDWRGRKYYIVTFCFDSYDMRMSFLKLIPNIKFTYYKNIPKQRDEIEERGNYQLTIHTMITSFVWVYITSSIRHWITKYIKIFF